MSLWLTHRKSMLETETVLSDIQDGLLFMFKVKTQWY